MKSKEIRKKCLVVVAHPDDETIWMGGYILCHPSWEWTILSLCRASDQDRAPKFHLVCKALGAKGVIADLDDEDRLTQDRAARLAKKIIADLDLGSFDLVFTHGKNGEYGHARHKSVHQAVKESVGSGKLSAGILYGFNYAKTTRKKYSLMAARPDSDFIYPLTDKVYKKKKKIMSEIYGFDPNGIDTSYCTNPEAFKIIK